MSSGAIARLRKEYTRLLKEPPANIEAKPLETNILEWHYVLNGPKGTIFEGGEYHGRIVFPKDYPFKPPGIYIMTPNGVFDTQVKVCLSMSDYHPETWNPLWSVNSILTGLLSFMMEPAPTIFAANHTIAQKRQYAAQSKAFNRRNRQFTTLFPHLCITDESKDGESQTSTQSSGKASPNGAAGKVDGKPSASVPRDTSSPNNERSSSGEGYDLKQPEGQQDDGEGERQVDERQEGAVNPSNDLFHHKSFWFLALAGLVLSAGTAYYVIESKFGGKKG